MQFKHDCDKCVPLAVLKEHDLYCCDTHSIVLLL